MSSIRLPLRLAALALLTLPVLASNGTPLERALEAVNTEKIQADVEFIGSDELAGRDTPSEGLRMCARFLRSRLVRLGWQPGAEEGYFHYYDLASRRIDPEVTQASFEGGAGEQSLALGEDYFFYAQGLGELLAEGSVVYCGAGDKDEFEGLDLDGRWALCMDGTEHWRRRERAASAAGAIGVLVVPGAEYEDEPYPERFARHLARTRTGGVSWPSEKSKERSVFPQTFLSSAAAREVFPELFVGERPALGHELAVTFTDRRALAGGGLTQLENVCGFWPGEGPLAEEVILISAHYDHVGERSNGDIYNGADDNGSGTAALMALAEALSEYGPMRRSVMLIWVSGEEKGLLGSRAWTLNPWLPEGCRAICNINVDMVGRNDPDYLLVTPTSARQEYNGLTRLAEKAAPLEGFGPLGSADSYWSRSDHANFAKNLEIPVAFLFSDVHEDYHKPTDTPDKIDSDKIRRVVRVLLRMVEGLQADSLSL